MQAAVEELVLLAAGRVLRGAVELVARKAVEPALKELEEAVGAAAAAAQVPGLTAEFLQLECLGEEVVCEVLPFSYFLTSQKDLPACQSFSPVENSFASLRERLILPSSSISMTFTGMVCPSFTISWTLLTR